MHGETPKLTFCVCWCS